MKFKALKLKKRTEVDDSTPSIMSCTLKGSLIAVAISLILVLVFAFIIKFISVPTDAIRPVVQVIKGISILVGTIIALKKVKQMGLINGLLIGLVYTVLSFVVFSILDGHFDFSITLINDLLFGGIIGAICGVIAVNFRK